MNDTHRIMVAKREGGIEPFDRGKPRRCMALAMKACRRDEQFAEALARAVELHLRDWPHEKPPSTEYVFRCLRKALTETGMHQVAQRLVRHRQRRAGQRKSVAVFSLRKGGRSLQSWCKSLLVTGLENQYGLSHAVARILAGEIERRVLSLEYSAVSKSLISELIRSELSAWGLATASAGNVYPTVGVDLPASPQTQQEN